ncbi:hypothetical protein [Novosphingobium sp.]|uniref:hypothetical protein n=1 Tax=Novosphingobium sp. TaxID=1874826 RepID=UPI0035B429F0
MLTITNSAEMASVLSIVTDATLKRILTDRVEQLSEYDGYDLGELAHFLIVQPGDALDAIEAALGFSPLMNLVDGVRYPSPDFVPSWEWITDHGGWFESVFILSDDGFGWVLLVPDHPAVLLDLVQLCCGASEAAATRL